MTRRQMLRSLSSGEVLEEMAYDLHLGEEQERSLKRAGIAVSPSAPVGMTPEMLKSLAAKYGGKVTTATERAAHA